MEQIITQEKSKKQNYHTLKVLFEKETADFINGKRMLLFILLMALITVTGLYAAVSGLADALESGNSSADFLFLKLFTVSANSIPSYNSLMALMGPFIGIFMGFDAINSERTEGTLNRLVSQPLYRDHIIIGKFLAGIFITAVMVFSSGILIAAVGLISTGLVPTGAEAARLFIYLCFCVVYIGFWLALAILFSTLCQHAATSALACIAVWLFCAIFISLLAGITADALYPVGGNDMESLMNEMDNYQSDFSLLPLWGSCLHTAEPFRALCECGYHDPALRRSGQHSFRGAEYAAGMASPDCPWGADASCLCGFLCVLYAAGNSGEIEGTP